MYALPTLLISEPSGGGLGDKLPLLLLLVALVVVVGLLC
jgi:hypothetical protein